MSGAEDTTTIGLSTMQRFDGIWYHDFFVKDREDLTSMMECSFGDDDIIVATYPKSGTAWLQRILSLIRNGGDVEKTDRSRLDENAKFLEPQKPPALLASEEPRVIKTHLAFQHLPHSFREGKGKIISLVRNPKDVLVSYFHFYKIINVIRLDDPFEDFFERFIKGDLNSGLWSEYVIPYWMHRNDANVLFLAYEDLQKDLLSKIKEIAKFWGKDLTDEQVEIIAEASTFNSMSKNKATNYQHLEDQGALDSSKSKYYRKGTVGDWKNHFTAEMSKRIDDMVEREITPLGMKLCYEL